MLASEEYAKPLPGQEAEWAPFWEAAARHELRIQYCVPCDRFQFPPVQACADCEGELLWSLATGAGVVHTFTIFHQLYHPGFAADLPYNVTVVRLSEGPMMITNLVGLDNSDIEIGLPVTVIFDDVAPGATLPKFTAAAAGSAR